MTTHHPVTVVVPIPALLVTDDELNVSEPELLMDLDRVINSALERLAGDSTIVSREHRNTEVIIHGTIELDDGTTWDLTDNGLAAVRLAYMLELEP